MTMESRLLLKILRQNKFYYLFLVGVFVFFLVILVYGGRIIYEMQASSLKDLETSALEENKKTVKEFFAECSRDLAFLKDLRGPGKRTDEGASLFRTGGFAKKTLVTFLKDRPYYTGITFVDCNGVVRIALNKSAGKLLSSASRMKSESCGYGEYLSRAMREGSDAMYTRFPGLRETDASTLEIISPVFTARGPLSGLLVIDTSIAQLLRRLSPSTYLQDGNGVTIGLDTEGKVTERREPRFSGGSGVVRLSDTESVYYSAVSYLPGQDIMMAKYFSHAAFKNSMARLEIISVIIFAAFFIFVLSFSFFSVKSVRRAMRAQNAIIHSLANLSEWRDPETGSHLERTRSFSVFFAKALRKSEKYRKRITEGFIEDLYDAVPLHDIGKVGIRDGILLKNGRLDKEEFETMKDHVLIGSDVIQDIIDKFHIRSSFLAMSRNICHSHHEKYDGTGYPDGLTGEEIPLEARIFAVCDVYDALRAKRPYKEGLPHDDTLEIIRGQRGRHFDPDMVDALLECRDEFYEIFESYKFFDDTYGRTLQLRSRDAMRVRWSDDLAVGNSDIDSQHKEFIDRTNAILSATLTGEGKRETLRHMRFLRDYARRHFRTEEEIMRECGYPDFTAHKSEHSLFVSNLAGVNATIRERGLSSDSVIRINKDIVLWLINHIMKSDRMLGRYLKSL
jgi:hemerythrin-like metal-binding protein